MAIFEVSALSGLYKTIVVERPHTRILVQGNVERYSCSVHRVKALAFSTRRTPATHSFQYVALSKTEHPAELYFVQSAKFTRASYGIAAIAKLLPERLVYPTTNRGSVLFSACIIQSVISESGLNK